MRSEIEKNNKMQNKICKLSCCSLLSALPFEFELYPQKNDHPLFIAPLMAYSKPSNHRQMNMHHETHLCTQPEREKK